MPIPVFVGGTQHFLGGNPIHHVAVPQVPPGPVASAIYASDVIDEVLERLAESVTSPVFWSRAELLGYLNDGFLEMTLMAGQLVSTADYAIIGAKLQAVPMGAIAILHIDRSSRVIEKSILEKFDRGNPGWEAQSGILQKWAPCGLDKWFADRHPVTDTFVSITTLDAPVELQESSQIDLAVEYIEGLADYVFHMARFKEGGAEFGQAMTQYDQFQNKAGLQEDTTYEAQFVLWTRDPNANPGTAYTRMEPRSR